MSFLAGLFVGGALTILFVALMHVGEDEKKLEDKEQEEWLREVKNRTKEEREPFLKKRQF